MEKRKTAAFFRVEGTLVRRGVLSMAAYVAANAKGFRERALRFSSLAVTAPLYALLGQNDRTMANRLAFLPFRGMSEDRIVVLAEEYFDSVMKDALLERGLDLIAQAREEGHRIVLLSENIEPVATQLKETVKGIDDVIFNRLEFRNGNCTGRLQEPIVGGHEVGKWIRAYAEEHNLHMPGSAAYGTHGPDLLLLAAVGRPCAVNPDYTLRRAASDADWPVMEYR